MASMEAPGGEPTHPHSDGSATTWPEQMQYKLEETLEAESLLLGRVTYEGFSAACQSARRVRRKMNHAKHVVSSTLEERSSEQLDPDRGDLAEEVGKLKEQDGGDPGRGQRHPRAVADRERPRRRAAMMVFPVDDRRRQAAIPRVTPEEAVQADRGPDF